MADYDGRVRDCVGQAVRRGDALCRDGRFEDVITNSGVGNAGRVISESVLELAASKEVGALEVS